MGNAIYSPFNCPISSILARKMSKLLGDSCYQAFCRVTDARSSWHHSKMEWKKSTCIYRHLFPYTGLRNSIASKDKIEIPARFCISKLPGRFSDSKVKKFVCDSQKPALIKRNWMWKASNGGKYNLETEILEAVSRPDVAVVELSVRHILSHQKV